MPFALYVLGIVIVPLVRKAETPAATKGQSFIRITLRISSLRFNRSWHPCCTQAGMALPVLQ